jgi:hypothetical protein
MSVGGNPQGLARAERELGLKSWCVAFDRTYFDYQSDEVLMGYKENPLVREIKRWLLLWRAVRDFDVVHFNFGSSIMPQWTPPPPADQPQNLSWLRWVYRFYVRHLELADLPLLKRAGKGIVVTYQGDDARQGDFCRAHFAISPADEVEPGYYGAESDARKRQRISRFAEYADRIFSLNPDLLHVLPPRAEFLPYSHIDLRSWQVAEQRHPNPTTPVVAHAPSHRGVKGTRFILDAVSRVQAEGLSLEFLLVEGLPHGEARHLYRRADLLIDQLLCGWYGGVAVEFMALGKPVICYVREDDLGFIPPPMRQDLPLIKATPASIHRVLREWLTLRRHELPEIGRLGRAYVEKWHDPLKIAARMKEEYGEIMSSKSKSGRH